MSTNDFDRFTSDELLDELLKRVGTDEAIRMMRQLGSSVASIDKLQAQLSDADGTIR
jgi:hypothetical protein